MADADDIERSLALAREALLPPEGALERVRVEVAKSRPLDARAGRAPSPRGVTKLTTTVLVGAGFIAGYWLGVHQSSVSSASSPTASSLELSPTAPGQPAQGSPAPESARSSALVSGDTASAEASGASSERRARAPARSTAGTTISAPADSHPPEPSGRAVLARRARPSTVPEDELTLLSRAERALRAGEAALALSFLDELDRRLPRSPLLEERSAARLLADCMLEAPDAPARAAQFLHQHRGSVYSDRLQSTCMLAAADHAAAPPANGTGADER